MKKTNTAGFSLKSFKHVKFMSEETECFDANVVFNGKVVAHASNQGHGGCNDIHLTDAGRAEPQVVAAFEMKEFDDNSLSSIVDELVANELQAKLDTRLTKKVQKDLSTQILFKRVGDKAGTYRFIKQKFPNAEVTKAMAEKFKASNPDAIVFNLLPFNEAFDLMVLKAPVSKV
jgi:hypothetical protein